MSARRGEPSELLTGAIRFETSTLSMYLRDRASVWNSITFRSRGFRAIIQRLPRRFALESRPSRDLSAAREQG
jgi:hypothetical protein